MRLLNLKAKFFLIFLVFLVINSAGIGISLYRQWGDIKTQNQDILSRDANIAVTVVENVISNGFKLLEIARSDLQKLKVDRKFTDDNIYHALNRATSAFSLYNDVGEYGILFLTNKDGVLIARSDGKPTSSIDFSDRYYFQDLRAHPNKVITIGPLLHARTTGRDVFHIASPVKDENNCFIGALVLQVQSDLFADRLVKVLSNDNASVIAINGSGQVVFANANSQITPNSQTGILFNMGASMQDRLVAFGEMPEIGVQIYLYDYLNHIRTHFLHNNLTFIIYAALGILIFTVMLWRLYHYVVEIHIVKISSLTDGLTNLPNRRAFDVEYDKFLGDARRYGYEISILFVDIDKFKVCNDTYGHENGDLVLKEVAKRLQSCMRRPLDFCCRWGGEELMALLPNISAEGAAQVAEHILMKMKGAPIYIQGYAPIFITVSIGVATATYNDALLENNLVDKADQAMFRAKQAGGDRYSF